MRVRWVCALGVLFLTAACSQVQTEPTLGTSSAGAYSDYSSVSELRYYKNVLSAQRWAPTKTLNYSPGYFAFPPLAGYRVLHYENPQSQTQIHLYREVVKNDTFKQIISRRKFTDHCTFTRSFYRQLGDLDIVEANADYYVWLYGDYQCKYYFLKAGNIVYTFRLLSPMSQYLFYEPDFDYFVNNAIDNYLVYSPREQISPALNQYAANKPKGKSELFSKQALVSFFSPVAARHQFPR